MSECLAVVSRGIPGRGVSLGAASVSWRSFESLASGGGAPGRDGRAWGGRVRRVLEQKPRIVMTYVSSARACAGRLAAKENQLVNAASPWRKIISAKIRIFRAPVRGAFTFTQQGRGLVKTCMRSVCNSLPGRHGWPEGGEPRAGRKVIDADTLMVPIGRNRFPGDGPTRTGQSRRRVPGALRIRTGRGWQVDGGV